MTDKQIIIDGVDVKDCKRRIGKDNFCRYYKRPCTENNYNCIWKKYLRKEQECEMWKNLTVDNGAVALKYQQQLDQLKEELEAYKMEAEEGKEINAELKAENEELKFQNKRLDEVALYWHKSIFKVERSERKLKQTLIEIKEICNNNDELKGNFNLIDCDKYKYGKHNLANKILQKISECEVGDKIKTVDLGFWDKNGEYKEDIQIFDII